MLAFLPFPPLDTAPCAGLSLIPLHSLKIINATPCTLRWPSFFIFFFILQCLAPLFSLTNNITPNSLVNTHTWPKHSPCFPPSKTAASRHWTGPPHLLGEVHPQCGKSCGAGGCSYHKPHWLAHYQWLVCSYNHVTLCCEFFLNL